MSETWRQFLSSPAAAPMLRAGWRYLSEIECAEIAEDAIHATTGNNRLQIFDVDTASALALLSWRGGAVGLCTLSLEEIMQECELRTWSLLDIPTETWGGLADLFTSGDLIIESQRSRFTTLVSAAVGASLDLRPQGTGHDDYDRAFADFWIHAIRIGVAENRQAILNLVTDVVRPNSGLTSAVDRSRVLLLMRWAREHGSKTLTRQIFKVGRDRFNWLALFGVKINSSLDGIDIENISMELTYREAMDLRWVIEILRQAGNSPTGTPASRPAPRRRRAR